LFDPSGRPLFNLPGANRRWRCQFRYRGSRRESAVAQLFSLGHIRAMSFKITPSSNRILDPLMVFGIIIGIVTLGVRIYQAIYPLASPARHIIFCVTLVGASVFALVYSLFALRNRLAMSWADRALYFFMPAVFLTVAGLALYILRV
jgi:hypothetical protein